MDPHLLSKSRSTFASMSTVAGTTWATQNFAPSTCNEKANAEWEGTVHKVTRPAAGIIMDRSTPPRLPSSQQGLMEDHDF